MSTPKANVASAPKTARFQMRSNPEVKAQATTRLMAELQAGWDSVEAPSDWISEEDAYKLLEAEV